MGRLRYEVDFMKAQRLMLLGQVHGVTVARADFSLDDGVTVAASLVEEAGFVEHEKVEISCLETGARLSCAVRGGELERGEVEVGGAAAHLLKPGAKVVISAFGWLKGKQAAKHHPARVRVND